ncbi:hypothetical protein LTR94_016858 [Friedmanniomyces endolithicus]|nr:hypothetical protein LTR94_016858 [Friedmanniomyces endolithicus]
MLQQLGQLAIAETQMVLLTPTLPPSLEDTLFERMFWQREEGEGVAARQAQLETIVTEALRDPTQPEGKVAVMCESVSGVEQISRAELFPCEPYHAEMSDTARKEVLDQFRDGSRVWWSPPGHSVWALTSQIFDWWCSWMSRETCWIMGRRVGAAVAMGRRAVPSSFAAGCSSTIR